MKKCDMNKLVQEALDLYEDEKNDYGFYDKSDF